MQGKILRLLGRVGRTSILHQPFRLEIRENGTKAFPLERVHVNQCDLGKYLGVSRLFGLDRLACNHSYPFGSEFASIYAQEHFDSWMV